MCDPWMTCFHWHWIKCKTNYLRHPCSVSHAHLAAKEAEKAAHHGHPLTQNVWEKSEEVARPVHRRWPPPIRKQIFSFFLRLCWVRVSRDTGLRLPDNVQREKICCFYIAQENSQYFLLVMINDKKRVWQTIEKRIPTWLKLIDLFITYPRNKKWVLFSDPLSILRVIC